MDVYLPDLLTDLSVYLSRRDLFQISSTRKANGRLIFHTTTISIPAGREDITKFNHIIGFSRWCLVSQCELDHLSKLSTFKELSLHNISGKIDLSGMVKLRSFTLGSPWNVNIIGFENLVNLTELQIDDSCSNIADISHLVNLTKLNLYGNKLIRTVSLPKLEWLRIKRTLVEDISKCTNLTYLDLDMQCTDLRTLTHLNELVLYDEEVLKTLQLPPQKLIITYCHY